MLVDVRQMRVVVIGTGYVGLVTGTCLAELGHQVVCVDKMESKISMLRQGKLPIYEPGLDELVIGNANAGRLSFTSHLDEALPGAEVVFIAVGTPTDSVDGHADLTYVFAAAEEIAKHLSAPAVIVVKSTVPVGTGKRVAQILAEHAPSYACEVVSNPEFLREGSAVQDFMQPDRVVVGTSDNHAAKVMQALYQPLAAKTQMLFMDKVESAELTKYACNAYLAMRISFVNEISDLCERLDADISDVTQAMGIDKRIGPYFLKPGPGYGGSCFPKDTLALNHTADAASAPSAMVKAAIASNDARKLRMAVKIADEMGGVRGKTIAVLGLTFKANTDDMRDSPSLIIVPELLNQGATLRVYDPQGMQEAKHIFKDDVTWCKDEYEAASGADAIVVLTEWKQFAAVDFKRFANLVKHKMVIDLRAIMPELDAKAEGFRYITVGKKETKENAGQLQGRTKKAASAH
jgi:UDPglucose 6-dehydrogenase